MNNLWLVFLVFTSISAFAELNGVYNLISGSSEKGPLDTDACPMSIIITSDDNYESAEVTEYYHYKSEDSRVYTSKKEKTIQGSFLTKVSSYSIYAVLSGRGILASPILSEYKLEKLDSVSPGENKLRRITFNRYENPIHTECFYVSKR